MSSQITRVNNYDFLRILAASMVIIGHSIPLTGSKSTVPGFILYPVHELAVIIFFSVSGFLVTRSADTTKRFADFFLKRLTRLLPALFTVVLVSIFVIGPALSTKGPLSFLLDPSTYMYLMNLIFYPVYSMPGVFNSLPYPSVVNGSLWTLPVEFACYLMAAVVVSIFGKAKVYVFASLLAVFVSTSLIFQGNLLRVVLYGSEIGSASGVAGYFMAGGTIYFLTRKFENFLRLDVATILLFLWIFSVQLSIPLAQSIGYLAVPYLVLAFAESSTPILRRAGRFGDPSYGMYLWAFPIQQLILSSRFSHLSLEMNILLVFILSISAGFVSWHFIEKIAMRRSLSRARTN